MADLDRLLDQVRDADPRALGRVISAVENNSPRLPEIIAALAPDTGRAYVIGLTGAPGVGKSTTTSMLISGFREAGRRVGVLAIDPSSPFSGGALLGDRVRMQAHALDPGTYVRSMAARGHLGGLAVAAPQALRVFDAAGFDVVLVETVGVGQSEIEIAGIADLTLVLLAPGSGDGVQAAKAGILEIGDLFVVNKSDRDGTQALIRELRTMTALGQPGTDAGRAAIVATTAIDGGGLAELLSAIEDFRTAQLASGAAARRRAARARREVETLAYAKLRERLPVAVATDLAAAVSRGELDPYAAADRLLAAWQPEPVGPVR